MRTEGLGAGRVRVFGVKFEGSQPILIHES